MYNNILDNMTVFFSGHNIKEIAWLAIASLIRYVPELKSNIVYFDDTSTDGSREFLESKGVKVITWNNYAKYTDFKEWYESTFSEELTSIPAFSPRNALICREMVERCTTKYCLINDGDVIYLSDYAIKQALDAFENGNLIYSVVDVTICNFSRTKDKIIKYCKGFKYAENMVNYSCKEDLYKDFESSRCRLFFTAFDLDTLRKVGRWDLTHDGTDNNTLAMINGDVTDGGGDLYYKLIRSSIKYKTEKYDNLFADELIHIAWASTSTRKSSGNTGFLVTEDNKSTIVHRLAGLICNERVNILAREVGIDLEETIAEHIYKLGMSGDQ